MIDEEKIASSLKPVGALSDKATASPALYIEGLKKTYAGGLQALKGIDLQVRQGDFFALLGPNGAGKSTTIGIMCTLILKTFGKVEIFGLDIEKHANAVKRLIGVVPQELNFSVFEKAGDIVFTQAGYYGMTRSQGRTNATKYLKMLGLWEARDQQGRHLSGGMKRRLMIARAMVHEPKLLILDEPTAGVDIEMRRSLWDFLQQINELGTTIILTTHYLEEAESLCRNIAIIDDGRIVQHSSMSDLLRLLDLETLVLDLETSLALLPDIPGHEVRQLSDRQIEVDVHKNQDIGTIFQALHQNNIKVTSLRNKHNRLEQLFIGLTGSKEQLAEASDA